MSAPEVPFTITIPGEPVAKGRPRFNRKTGSVYTPARTKAYEAKVRAAVLEKVKRIRPTKLPVSIGLSFELTSPIASKPDLDNLIKAVTDACNGILWADDAQITQIVAGKSHAAKPSMTLIFW